MRKRLPVAVWRPLDRSFDVVRGDIGNGALVHLKSEDAWQATRPVLHEVRVRSRLFPWRVNTTYAAVAQEGDCELLDLAEPARDYHNNFQPRITRKIRLDISNEVGSRLVNAANNAAPTSPLDPLVLVTEIAVLVVVLIIGLSWAQRQESFPVGPGFGSLLPLFGILAASRRPAGDPLRPSNIRTAVDWCVRAAKADRLTAAGFAVLLLGLAAAWLLPLFLVLRTGQFFALLYLPFMGTALSSFVVIPPVLFLLPRLFVWDGRTTGRTIDLTRFMHPADFEAVDLAEKVWWRGRRCRLRAGDGGGFIGRIAQPTVTSGSFFRAVHKSALMKYAKRAKVPWRRLQYGTLAVIIIATLFIGLLASAE